MIPINYSKDIMASKGKPITIDTKLQALAEIDKKSRIKERDSRGIPCSVNILLTRLKNKMAHGNFVPSLECGRTARHSDIESALLVRFKAARAQKSLLLIQFSEK